MHIPSPVRLALVFALTLPALASAQTTHYTAPPASQGASLVGRDRSRINDRDFGTLMKSLLVKPDGSANARDAKFFFQQCYGGGMLSGVDRALGASVPWVGGSAARYNQLAYGGGSAFDENAPPGVTYNNKFPPSGGWTGALAISMNNNPGASLLTIANEARDGDFDGVNGSGKEEGQSLVRNGGQSITFNDPGATSHHAIIWGGQADGVRHFNNANYVRTALQNAWAGTNFTITTLFGNGRNIADTGAFLPDSWNAKSATIANLRAEVEALKAVMNPGEQFFFYSTGHGGSVTYVPPPAPIPARTTSTVSFIVDSFQTEPWFVPNNPVPIVPVITLDLRTAGLTPGNVANVSLNGNSLGSLLLSDASAEEFTFDLDVTDTNWLLEGENVLTIESLADAPLDFSEITFDNGSISEVLGNAVAPEPGAGALLLLGLLARRRRA